MKALSEWASKAALGDIPRPVERLTRSAADAVAFARQLGRPVVAKASDMAHKTDFGAVRLGLDPDGLAQAWPELAALGDGTVLVAEQVDADLELIVGGLRDPQFGPVVSVGLGGVAAEVLNDVVFLLAPVAPGELERALGELRGAALLNGHRGRVPLDRAGLSKIVDAVARLLVDDESVVEIDCNPVLVSRGRPLVADALVVRRGGPAGEGLSPAAGGGSPPN
jgi:hypothetical protein